MFNTYNKSKMRTPVPKTDQFISISNKYNSTCHNHYYNDNCSKKYCPWLRTNVNKYVYPYFRCTRSHIYMARSNKQKICFGGYLFITHIVEGLKAESTTFVNSTTIKISYWQVKHTCSINIINPGWEPQGLKMSIFIWFRTNNFPIWTIWSYKIATKIHLGQSVIVFLQK
jgi:hypothetical protein